ncbi:MAG: ATP-dependent DNA helicase [Candidatus Nanoarchaeia archaeon]
MSTSLFPHSSIREIQDVLITEVAEAVKNNQNLIVHAPTGLGKTAASIAPALSNTLKTKKTIFFLSSMHTQHKIAIDTVREIRAKHGVKVIGVDIIGKKHMCLQEGVSTLLSREFLEYCKTLREDDRCNYFSNLKKDDSLSFEAKLAVSELNDLSPSTTRNILDVSGRHKVCPYEVSMLIGREANIIVTDYYYLFHPKIRNSFLTKTGKELQDAVIIVDEAHNLPARIRDLASEKLSTIILKRAITEAEYFNNTKAAGILRKILPILEDYATTLVDKEDEIYVEKNDFFEKINVIEDYYAVIDFLAEAATEVRKEQKQSYMGTVAGFLEAWPSEQEGFTRIFSKIKGLKEEILVLNYKCLDPSVISRPVIEAASSVILMSGTLTPTSMYRELLGFREENTVEMTLKSPFPEKNKLSLIIPKTSTKFTGRSEYQYREMGQIVSKIVNAIPGNSAVFFPSFKLRDDVYAYMKECEKTVFLERQGLTKQEKEELLENFKSYKNVGAVLLGATMGSFGEGIDLPGDYLKGVIIVGLPLQRPDLETKALIDYFDKKFKKGWDYGYVFPAFNKTLQSAGRCIRSETDRGVIVFLDERYSWPQYMRCFPPSWNLKTTILYESLIREFFDKEIEKTADDKLGDDDLMSSSNDYVKKPDWSTERKDERRNERKDERHNQNDPYRQPEREFKWVDRK